MERLLFCTPPAAVSYVCTYQPAGQNGVVQQEQSARGWASLTQVKPWPVAMEMVIHATRSTAALHQAHNLLVSLEAEKQFLCSCLHRLRLFAAIPHFSVK
ncbi:hypothetical protein XENTR_v10006797 [Xenopus tropicalis]|nr:hypothetical protein XENTR_v10006797 [Xenopus tropicalis]